MNYLSRCVRLLFALLPLLGACKQSANTDTPREFRTSVVVGPNGPWGGAATRFADLLRERSAGRIQIKNYFNGQLFAGQQKDELLLLSTGVADFAFGSVINWSPFVPELNLFLLPFFLESYADVDAIEHGEAGRRLFTMLEQKGVVPLCWGENGFRELTNRKRPLRRPEDLAGLKIRVVDCPIFKEMFAALGAIPVGMNWTEALQAITQGAVDGQENPVVSVIIPSKLWQSHKYITLWHYALDPIVLGASKKTWQKLSADDRALIQSAADAVCGWQKEQSRAGLEQNGASLAALQRNGMEIVELSAAERAAFQERTRPVFDNFSKQVGVDLLRAAEKDMKRPGSGEGR